MARTLNRLSDRKLKATKERARLADGGGLWFNRSATRSASWVYRWTIGGRAREMGLGPYPAVSLSDARAKAAECRAHVAAGRDPRGEMKRAEGTTFGEVADQFLREKLSPGLHVKSLHQWRVTVEEHCAPIRGRPIAEVGLEDVLACLKDRWLHTPETARRIRGRMERILDFATVKSLRSGENPARWRGVLEHVLPTQAKAKGHFRALPVQEAPALYGALCQREALSALALRFGMLCATRPGETVGALWDEIDFDGRVWRLPPERMKARAAHDVPLSAPAMVILGHLHERRLGAYVFPGARKGHPLSNGAFDALLERLGFDQKTTAHGLRSTFRDWAGDVAGVPREIAEACIAHKVTGVEASYRRGTALEKRREVMEQWAEFLTQSAKRSHVQ